MIIPTIWGKKQKQQSIKAVNCWRTVGFGCTELGCTLDWGCERWALGKDVLLVHGSALHDVLVLFASGVTILTSTGVSGVTTLTFDFWWYPLYFLANFFIWLAKGFKSTLSSSNTRTSLFRAFSRFIMCISCVNQSDKIYRIPRVSPTAPRLTWLPLTVVWSILAISVICWASMFAGLTSLRIASYACFPSLSYQTMGLPSMQSCNGVGKV